MIRSLAFVGLSSLALNALITPLVLWLSHRNEWYDEIDHRKIHLHDTPRLGGIGIFVSLVTAVVLGLTLLVPSQLMGEPVVLDLVLVGIGFGLMFGLGLYDDFVNLPALVKLGGQIISATVIALSGLVTSDIVIPYAGTISLSQPVGIVFAVFWIVALANAVNLIDGADGMAGSTMLISAAFMGVIALSQGRMVAALLAFAIAGSLAAFLLSNAPPARIFMGDSGSLTLGAVMATIPLLGLSSDGAMPLFSSLTLLCIPILDTALAIGRRLSRGLPIHAPDREHIHHLLIDHGYEGKRLLVVAGAASIVLGIVAALWFAIPESIALMVTVITWALIVTLALRGRRPAS